MKKIILAVISNVLMVLLPLIGHLSLITHPKIIFIIIGSICVWLTQPAFSVSETSDKKQSDKFSVILILTMSMISGIVPIIDWAYFSNVHETVWMTITGVVMIVSGIFIRAWSVKTLGDFFTPTVQIRDEHQLINNGPYKIVRHPSYFGTFLFLTGGAVLLGSWIGIAVSILSMTVAYYVRITIEEQKLLEHFGDHYRNYMLNTKKIIPFVL